MSGRRARPPRRAGPALLSAALALGCAGAPPEPAEPAGPAAPLREAADDPLDLARLARAVIVGRVVETEVRPGGRRFTVEVEGVVASDPADDPDAERDGVPALAEGDRLAVSAFVFAAGRSAEVGELEETARYLFFLAPSDRRGEWLNLADPAGYRLPGARGVVDRLRRAGRQRAAAR